MTVLLTGAHGTVGTAVTTGSAYEYVLLDREEPAATLGDGTPHPHRDRETILLDVGDPGTPESLAAVLEDEGIEAIVHLAGSPAVSSSYEAVERNNVRGTRTVLEAAARAGVETVVFASSNHAVGMYEREHAPALYEPDYALTVDHESQPRPDSDYGASKVAGEAWCRRYAELEGIDCYALRIGSVRNPVHDHPFGDAERAVARGDCERGDPEYEEQVARMRCTWLSRRDCAALVDACLDDGLTGEREADGVTGERRADGVTREGGGDRNDEAALKTAAGGAFEVLYGISDNPNAWFDIERARERVGYEPVDSGNAMQEPP